MTTFRWYKSMYDRFPILDTSVGRYLIRRDSPGGQFRAFLNGAPTRITGSSEDEVQKKVQSALAGITKATK